jgi:hypothetical protein
MDIVALARILQCQERPQPFQLYHAHGGSYDGRAATP